MIKQKNDFKSLFFHTIKLRIYQQRKKHVHVHYIKVYHFNK